jgi:toxin ParE1/3/4
LQDTCDYVAADNPRAAVKVRAAVGRAADQLARFPNAGRAGLVIGTRELVVTGLPYIIVYRVIGDNVEILRIHHASTNWAAKGRG